MEYLLLQKGEVKFRTRLSDNYVDATQLAKCLDVNIGQWRATTRYQKQLQDVIAKTNKSEDVLFLPRRKHSTFIHPLLALELVHYSKSNVKNVALHLLSRQNGDESDESESECESVCSAVETNAMVELDPSVGYEEKAKAALPIDGIVVIQRESDGMINLTSLCKAGKKLFGHWYENETTKRFLLELSNYLNKSIDELLKVGEGPNMPTYGHPNIAIHIAQWVSPKFSVLVTEWVRSLLTQGFVTINEPKVTIAQEKEIEYKFAQLEFEKQKFEKEHEEKRKEQEEARKYNTLEKTMAMVEKLSGGKLEVNHCVFFKEIYLNMIKNSTFVHGNLPTTSSPLELKGDQVTLAIVASQKGLVLDTKDLIKLGKHVSQKYQALHGKKPEKHMQMHHGRAIPINTFFECDRALIEEAINELFDE